MLKYISHFAVRLDNLNSGFHPFGVGKMKKVRPTTGTAMHYPRFQGNFSQDLDRKSVV